MLIAEKRSFKNRRNQMQKIEWDKLGFEFTPTKSNLRFTYKDGKWDDGELFDT